MGLWTEPVGPAGLVAELPFWERLGLDAGSSSSCISWWAFVSLLDTRRDPLLSVAIFSSRHLTFSLLVLTALGFASLLLLFLRVISVVCLFLFSSPLGWLRLFNTRLTPAPLGVHLVLLTSTTASPHLHYRLPPYIFTISTSHTY